MILSLSPASARLGVRIRFGLLTLVALLIGHSTVYATRFGVGDAFRSAMSASGHDGYWEPFTALALVAGIVLIVGSVLTIARLHRRLRGLRVAEGGASPDGSYRREVTALWPRLFLMVVALFALQENLETWLSTGDVPGVDVLLGSGLPVTPLVLAAVTITLAALGAMVRWRIATLRECLDRAVRASRSRPTRTRPSPEWADIHAAAPHRWTADRRDAGRAPPLALPA